MRRASARPSISGMCMSRIARSKRSPPSEPAQRLARRLGVARQHAPLARPAARARGGWSRCRRRPARACPASSGCAPTNSRRCAGGSSAIGAHDREAEGRAVARAGALDPHRAAHQLGQPLADRQAEAGAAVLARRRSSRPARTTGTAAPCPSARQADAGVAHRERAARRGRRRPPRCDRQHHLAAPR